MGKKIFSKSLSKLYSSISIMIDNLKYIRNELPNLKNAPEDLKNEVKIFCQEFESTLFFEVRKEIGNLGEKLEKILDNKIIDSSGIKITSEFIKKMIWKKLESMHILVTKLQKLPKTNYDIADMKVLMNESAANILYAFKDMRETLDFISAQKKEPYS